MSHQFALKSSYAAVDGEMPFTNYTPNFVDGRVGLDVWDGTRVCVAARHVVDANSSGSSPNPRTIS